MHDEVKEFIERMRKSFAAGFEAGRVLECGSLDVNGSPREYFPNATEYVGVDWRAGKGVDAVSLVHQYKGKPDGYFDFVLCTEMLEHDPYWEQSCRRMMSLLVRGGVLLVTCGGPGRRPHRLDTAPQQNYYKNLTMGQVATAIFSSGHGFKAARMEEDDESCDVRFFGWRKR